MSNGGQNSGSQQVDHEPLLGSGNSLLGRQTLFYGSIVLYYYLGPLILFLIVLLVTHSQMLRTTGLKPVQ